jgi:hypothetical protein
LLCQIELRPYNGGHQPGELGTPDSVQTVICLRTAFADLAAPGLSGITRPYRRRCDETEPMPGPLTLLPVARSPSRLRYRQSLVGSYPTVSPLTRIPKRDRWRACFLLRL